MAKLILLCRRHGLERTSFSEEAAILAKRLMPGNFTPSSPKIIHQAGVHIAIFNPNDLIQIQGGSVAMGYLFEPDHEWGRPGKDIPDGSMALFRSSQEAVELATDLMGSRAIWYAKTPSLFIASTSQRAIVHFLGSFEPNEEAHAWMLSSGTIGPGISWDRRIRALPLNSRLYLDRLSWRTDLISGETIFSPENRPQSTLLQELQNIIQSALDRIKIDPQDWVLPLSGGYDSRMLLLQFHRNYKNIRCVTWGKSKAQQQRWTDAAVATDLCKVLNVNHTYFDTEISEEGFSTVFERFLTAGEGRIDQFEPYLDGFELWRQLSARNVKGIIRGDECFGSRTLYSELDFRKFCLATMLSDYDDFKNMQLTDTYPQNWPNNLNRRASETLEMWRDRLYTDYLFPVWLSALNELKQPYVEIMTPFISREIIHFVRRLPDSLRTEKTLFRAAVTSCSPNVPFAKYPAIDLGRSYLKRKDVLEFMHDLLHSTHCRGIFPPVLIEAAIWNLHNNGSKPFTQKFPLTRKIRPFLHPRMVKAIQKTLNLRERVDYFDLALRCCIIDAMAQHLEEDAKVFHSSAESPSFPFKTTQEPTYPITEHSQSVFATQ